MKAKLIISGILLLSSLLPKIDAQQAITLKQAILIAKDNNPILKTEIFNEDIAKTDIITAKIRPNLVLNNQSLMLAKPGLYEPNTNALNTFNRQTYWQLTKQIIPMHQWKRKVSLMEINAKLMKNNYMETERTIFLQVGNKWIDAWYNKTIATLLLRANTIVDSVINGKNNLKQPKQISGNDLMRMQLLADQYKLQVKAAQQNYTSELFNLKFLIGAKGTVNIDANDNFFSTAITSKIDSLLYFALNNRADLQTGYTNIAFTKKNEELQKALAWPIPDVGIIYNPQNGVQYIGFYGNIELPVFYRNQGEIQKSKILEQQAEQSLQLTQQQVVNEVKGAINSYLVQKQNLEAYKKVINQSELVLNNIKYAYLAGTSTIVDFMEAQRSWLDVQKMYYEALYNYRKSYIQVLYVTGLINAP